MASCRFRRVLASLAGALSAAAAPRWQHGGTQRWRFRRSSCHCWPICLWFDAQRRKLQPPFGGAPAQWAARDSPERLWDDSFVPARFRWTGCARLAGSARCRKASAHLPVSTGCRSRPELALRSCTLSYGWHCHPQYRGLNELDEPASVYARDFVIDFFGWRCAAPVCARTRAHRSPRSARGSRACPRRRFGRLSDTMRHACDRPGGRGGDLENRARGRRARVLERQ